METGSPGKRLFSVSRGRWRLSRVRWLGWKEVDEVNIGSEKAKKGRLKDFNKSDF